MPPPANLRALSRRLLRFALRLAVAALLCIALLYCGLRAYTLYLTHRAISLLDEAARIQIGATEDSIRPFVSRHGFVKWNQYSPVSCDDAVNKADCAFHNAHLPDYAWEVDLSPFNVFSAPDRPGGRLHRAMTALMIETPSSWRDPLSLRDSIVFVQVSIRAQHVDTVYTGLYVEGRTRWLGNNWQLAADIPDREYDMRLKAYGISGTFLTFPGNGGAGTEHYLTPAATPEQVQVAHSFNARCLTGLIPCRCLSDLSPQAFQYMGRHPEVGSTIMTDDCPNPHTPWP